MRVPPSSLSAHLKKGLAPIYHLFGGEVLLIEEAVDEVRRQARAQGFGERIRHTLEPGFDWDKLLADGRSASLFAEKKIIELRMPGGKPGVGGDKALMEYADGVDGGDDTVLVVIGGALNKQAQNVKWFKKIDDAGVTVEYASLPAAKLPQWIGGRMQQKGLSFDADAAGRLAHFVEGNLLAAAQEIDLLALLSPNEKITAATVETAIADHARFTVFTFTDACLAGSAHRSMRILQSLRRNHAEPVLILWALTRETRTLCHLAVAGDARDAYKRHGVWASRAGLIKGALKRLPAARCHNLLRRLARADLMLKGRAPMRRANIWEEIESIALGLCGVRVV